MLAPCILLSWYRVAVAQQVLERGIELMRQLDCILRRTQVLNLKGLGWLYRQSFFLYAMFGIAGLSLIWFCIKGPEPFRRRKPEDIYDE